MDVLRRTNSVIFTVKTSLDVFSLRREHVWTCSVLGDRICEIKRVTDFSCLTQSSISILKHVLLPQGLEHQFSPATSNCTYIDPCLSMS